MNKTLFTVKLLFSNGFRSVTKEPSGSSEAMERSFTRADHFRSPHAQPQWDQRAHVVLHAPQRRGRHPERLVVALAGPCAEDPHGQDGISASVRVISSARKETIGLCGCLASTRLYPWVAGRSESDLSEARALPVYEHLALAPAYREHAEGGILCFGEGLHQREVAIKPSMRRLSVMSLDGYQPLRDHCHGMPGYELRLPNS